MRVLLVFLLLLLPGLAGAQTQLRLAPVSAGQAALVFDLQPGWHIYWQNPGDSGFPPRVSVGGPLSFPAPSWLVESGIGVYVLSGHVVLPFAFTGTNVTASWLECADICVPKRAYLTLTGPAVTPVLPLPSPFAATLAPDGTLNVTGPTQVQTAHFFPLDRNMLNNAAAQPLSFTSQGFALRLPLTGSAPAQLSGVLEITDPSGVTQAVTLTTKLGAEPGHPPYWALALLGGLLLNLMPCVFPILALKAFAIARLSGAAHGHIRREALAYAAGVMASMLALAAVLLVLRTAGHAVFWGFQFHAPLFVAVAAAVMLGAALNMAGLFELPTPAFVRHIPAQHSFLTGLLAVLVATPCTAPFMGPAVAAALALPNAPALGIFAALGLGLALPVLMLAFFPALAATLPRPGAWMRWVQRILSLPLFATALWLFWVLALPLVQAPPLSLPGSTPYTPQALAQARAANQPVFIDLTAAWCVTCLINETGVLNAAPVQAAFTAHHVRVLVGDWTSKNAAITALLAQNGRAGVPLYLYYAPGAATPVLLQQILTPGDVIATLGHN